MFVCPNVWIKKHQFYEYCNHLNKSDLYICLTDTLFQLGHMLTTKRSTTTTSSEPWSAKPAITATSLFLRSVCICSTSMSRWKYLMLFKPILRWGFRFNLHFISFFWVRLSIQDNAATPFPPWTSLFCFSLGRSPCQFHLFKVSLKGFPQGHFWPSLFPFAWRIPS